MGVEGYTTKFCTGRLHPLPFHSGTLAPSGLLWVIKFGLDIHVMIIIRELKHQAFLRTRTWGDRVETKSKTPFLAPIFVLSTRLPATDAAGKFKKCKLQCKHWFSRGNLRIKLSFSLHGVF